MASDKHKIMTKMLSVLKFRIIENLALVNKASGVTDGVET
jgi:hypothetical protein